MLCVHMDVSHKTSQIISLFTDFVCFQKWWWQKGGQICNKSSGIPDAPRQEGIPLSRSTKAIRGERGLEPSVLPLVRSPQQYSSRLKLRNYLEYDSWHWRVGSVSKSAYCSSRVPEFSSQHPCQLGVGLTSAQTLTPGDLTPSFDLHRHLQSHVHITTRTQRHTSFKKKKN